MNVRSAIPKLAWAASSWIQVTLALSALCMAHIVADHIGEERIRFYSPPTRFSLWFAPYLIVLAMVGTALPFVLARKQKGSLFALSLVSLLMFLGIFCVMLIGFILPFVVIRCK